MERGCRYALQIHFPSVGEQVLGLKEKISIVSCQKGPTRHAYAWQIGHFWQDTLDITYAMSPLIGNDLAEP